MCLNQELNNLLHMCDVFELKPCWISPNLMDTPIMEVLSRTEVCVCVRARACLFS